MSTAMQHISPRWPEARFRHLADVRKGRLPDSSDGAMLDSEKAPYLTMEYLRGEINEPPLVPIDADILLASDDDILLLWDGSNAGEFLRAKRGVVSSTTALVTPKFVDPSFFFWACKGQEDRVRAETVGMGIPHVNGDFLANLRIPLPDLDQQRAIADYIDHETTRLDALIVAKEQVLGLLADKRRALIARAVTRGLDSNMAMRNAEVPWLTEMPAHWSHRKIRFCCVETRTGGTPAPEFLDYEGEEGGLNWFTPGDFSENLTLCRSKRRVAKAALDAGELRMFPSGAVLIVGIGATLGKVGLLCSPASANQQINALITCSDIDSVFLAYELSVIDDFMLASANMATLPILNLQRMSDVSVLVPPIKEQRTIVKHIVHQTANIDKIRIETERTIAILKARRATLITTAVTGQMEVI